MRDILYSCGDEAFDPARLEGSGDLEHAQTALGGALRRLIRTPEAMGGEGWRVLHKRGSEVLAAAPSPEGEHSFATALFERSGGKWKPQGWGDCEPMAVVGERSPAVWRLDTQPTENATELQLLVEELACSSGRALTDENTRADIQYSENSIMILVTVDPLDAGKNAAYTCIGAPPSPITIKLDEPVQGRQLIDVGTYPSARRDK